MTWHLFSQRRKVLLYFFLVVWLYMLFELAAVYFIMPLPGSQEMNSITVAYFQHSFRWVFRVLLGMAIIYHLPGAWKQSRWWTSLLLVTLIAVGYMTNMQMSADTMFYKPRQLIMTQAEQNSVSLEKIVLGIVHHGEAHAYPIQFLGYHHQVPDTIAGQPVLVTYCTVCRTGRAFQPIVKGKPEQFRLVGMDHFNAMFEDHTSGTWWRQVTGEAVAGPLKGQQLPEMHTTQTSLRTWLSMYPQSLIMQPDSHFLDEYEGLKDFETGTRKGKLTRRDTLSWHDKSWVAGIEVNGVSKAYDWNLLVQQYIILDSLGSTPIAVMVSNDQKGVLAFERHSFEQQLFMRHDTLTDGVFDFQLTGQPMDTIGRSLKPLQVYQEYWHSWKTFHPFTLH